MKTMKGKAMKATLAKYEEQKAILASLKAMKKG